LSLSGAASAILARIQYSY